MIIRAILILVLALGACTQRTEPYRTAVRPTDAAFAAAVPVGHTRFSNQSLAELFGDLHFDTEWGEAVPELLRLNAPINVALNGPGSAQYTGFLDRFLGQISAQANIDAARGQGPHNLFIWLVPGTEWGPLAGNQCVIVFGKPTWPEFLIDRRRYSDYSAVSRSELALRTIFIPNTNEPHEIRECLIEEIVQSLGPSNDIYGLGPSIFNDDDAHVWPTRLDYLMLRVLYDPEMDAGIRRQEAVRRARRILDRVNPDGQSAPRIPKHRQMDFLAWRENLHELFDMINSGDGESDRAHVVMKKIVGEAETRAPASPYHCEALSVAASMEREAGSARAKPALDRARQVCERVHGKADVRAASLKLAHAIMLIGDDKNRSALTETEGLPEVFLSTGQEALLAMTHAVRWTALFNMDDPKADAARRKAVAWSAYAFGDDHETVQQWRRLW